MEQQHCNAIKATGDVCGKNVRHDGKCGIHHAAMLKAGPNTTALKELHLLQKKEMKDLQTRYAEEGVDRLERHAQAIRITAHLEECDVMRARHKRETRNLEAEQSRLIRQTGIDPDQPARQRAAARVAEQRRVMRQRIAEMQLEAAEERRRDRGIDELQWEEFNAAARLGAAVRVIVPAQGQLAAFAADAQNVHTTAAVNQTKDIVARIRQVEVPEEYRWHPVNCSKTPFEIGLECKLSQRAAWQMVSQYAQPTAIYDIEEGIYGKVLDCVWQFVKASTDKEDLCRIIKNEMEDNVGMCAQGNLSRICNILAGFMDGVGSQESLAEKLGNIFAKLAEIDDPEERFNRAAQELVWNKVPKDQWMTWAEPLADDAEQHEMLMTALGY